MKEADRPGSWTFLTGHGHVLVEIARDPRARIRDIAAAAGLTERTVQAIVTDLEAEGYLTRTRTGRRTRYTVNKDSLFRHPAQDGHRVGPFLTLLAATGDAQGPDDGHRPLILAEPLQPLMAAVMVRRNAMRRRYMSTAARPIAPALNTDRTPKALARNPPQIAPSGNVPHAINR